MKSGEIDQVKLEALSGKVMGDVGGALSVLMAYLGDQAGVFDAMDAAGPKHLHKEITRAKFEQLASKLVERTRGPCEQALRDAKLSPGDVDEVILVGGSTRIPAVQELVKNVFNGKSKIRIPSRTGGMAAFSAISAGRFFADFEKC